MDGLHLREIKWSPPLWRDAGLLLRLISSVEGVDQAGADSLAAWSHSRGDLRQAIMRLQFASLSASDIQPLDRTIPSPSYPAESEWLCKRGAKEVHAEFDGKKFRLVPRRGMAGLGRTAEAGERLLECLHGSRQLGLDCVDSAKSRPGPKELSLVAELEQRAEALSHAAMLQQVPCPPCALAP
jgi:hypothetical protein